MIVGRATGNDVANGTATERSKEDRHHDIAKDDNLNIDISFASAGAADNDVDDLTRSTTENQDEDWSDLRKTNRIGPWNETDSSITDISSVMTIGSEYSTSVENDLDSSDNTSAHGSFTNSNTLQSIEASNIIRLQEEVRQLRQALLAKSSRTIHPDRPLPKTLSSPGSEIIPGAPPIPGPTKTLAYVQYFDSNPPPSDDPVLPTFQVIDYETEHQVTDAIETSAISTPVRNHLLPAPASPPLLATSNVPEQVDKIEPPQVAAFSATVPSKEALETCPAGNPTSTSSTSVSAPEEPSSVRKPSLSSRLLRSSSPRSQRIQRLIAIQNNSWSSAKSKTSDISNNFSESEDCRNAEENDADMLNASLSSRYQPPPLNLFSGQSPIATKTSTPCSSVFPTPLSSPKAHNHETHKVTVVSHQDRRMLIYPPTKSHEQMRQGVHNGSAESIGFLTSVSPSRALSQLVQEGNVRLSAHDTSEDRPWDPESDQPEENELSARVDQPEEADTGVAVEYEVNNPVNAQEKEVDLSEKIEDGSSASESEIDDPVSIHTVQINVLHRNRIPLGNLDTNIDVASHRNHQSRNMKCSEPGFGPNINQEGLDMDSLSLLLSDMHESQCTTAPLHPGDGTGKRFGDGYNSDSQNDSDNDRQAEELSGSSGLTHGICQNEGSGMKSASDDDEILRILNPPRPRREQKKIESSAKQISKPLRRKNFLSSTQSSLLKSEKMAPRPSVRSNFVGQAQKVNRRASKHQSQVSTHRKNKDALKSHKKVKLDVDEGGSKTKLDRIQIEKLQELQEHLQHLQQNILRLADGHNHALRDGLEIPSFAKRIAAPMDVDKHSFTGNLHKGLESGTCTCTNSPASVLFAFL